MCLTCRRRCPMSRRGIQRPLTLGEGARRRAVGHAQLRPTQLVPILLEEPKARLNRERPMLFVARDGGSRVGK